MTHVHLSAPAPRAVRVPDTNPLIPISDVARLVIIVYFVVWRIIPTLAVLEFENTIPTGYAIAIAAARLGNEVLLLLPFLINRFAGTPIGWLHPLVLIPLISITFGIIRNPGSLLEPLAVWGQSQMAPRHQLLPGWPVERLLESQALMNFAGLIGTASTMMGFALMRGRWAARAQVRRIELNGQRLAILFVLFVLIVFFFLQQQGGVLKHMATLAGGRFYMREASGQFLVLNAFLPYLLLLWYVYRPSTLRNPVFVSAVLFAAIMQFVVTGSRSGLIAPIAAFLVAWMFLNRKVPAIRAVLLGLLAVVLLNALGEIRRSGRDGEVDFSALLEFKFADAWQASQEELAGRVNNASLAVFAMVPRDVHYIHGETYLAAVGFMIPRAIWRNKPRGGGAYAAALLFHGLPSADGYSGAAYPIDGIAEAYWSFDLPGVILIFLLYGGIMRLIVDWVRFDPADPFAVIVLISFTLILDTPNTDGVVSFLQRVVLLGLVYLLVARRSA